MVTRVFLGWDRPLCESVAAWLLERRDRLPGMCVVVPTSQSARILRDRLAAKAGTLLAPEFTTPSQWLRLPVPDAAPDWLELTAWVQSLQDRKNWESLEVLFPKPPEDQQFFPLARDLRRLAARLQENGHTFGSAARDMVGSRDSERWHCLGRLEQAARKQLADWGATSRNDSLARLDESCFTHEEYVLAGVPDLPPWLASRLRKTPLPIHALVGAPGELADRFDELGLPLEDWQTEPMPWPDPGNGGGVHLATDSNSQIRQALQILSDTKTRSDQVSLGTGAPDLGKKLVPALTARGWPAFNPAPSSHPTGLRRWLLAWQNWVREPSLGHLHDLISLPESNALGDGPTRFQALESLGYWRNERMARTIHDLRRIPESADHRRAPDRFRLLAITEIAEQWRNEFLAQPFPDAISILLDRIHETSDEVTELREWIHEITPWCRKLKQPATFWFDLMHASLPPVAPSPPADRVIDVVGWLELPYQPGNHLIVCGMNEGAIPATLPPDPWLGEDACQRLGLPSNTTRAARDSFLARHLHETRRQEGRVDWICGKSGSDGTTLLPSRILLQATGGELARRVSELFRELPVADVRIRRQNDWQWKLPQAQAKQRISVTAFRDWLTCPFRYYVKHHHRMEESEPHRIEWNHRDFGNMFHRVVEEWAKDEEARDFNKVDHLTKWLGACLDRMVAGYYGKSPTLAVRIQTEALRARLGWFAHKQAILRAEGWQPREIEKPFELSIGGMTVRGTIDRIDFHQDFGWRVIDYKTSAKPTPVVKAHCAKVTDRTRIEPHWGEDSPVFFEDAEKGKSASFRWTNLQLPLYAAWLRNTEDSLAEPCYINVGSALNQVKVEPWSGFSERHLDAALSCAEWIISRIGEGQFWPPVEKAPFQNDLVTNLSCGWPTEKMFLRPESGN